MASLELTLYVTGRSARSAQAIGNLHRICQEKMGGDCDVTIIDVLEDPDLAEEHKIIATPTLIKSSPWPVRRIIGDLSDLNEVALRLGLYDFSSKDITEGEEQ